MVYFSGPITENERFDLQFLTLYILKDLSGVLAFLPSCVRKLNEEISNMVTEVNVLSQRIHELNQSIVRSEAAQPGSPTNNTNDMRDQRDQAIKELAQLVNVNVSEYECEVSGHQYMLSVF